MLPLLMRCAQLMSCTFQSKQSAASKEGGPCHPRRLHSQRNKVDGLWKISAYARKSKKGKIYYSVQKAKNTFGKAKMRWKTLMIGWLHTCCCLLMSTCTSQHRAVDPQQSIPVVVVFVASRCRREICDNPNGQVHVCQLLECGAVAARQATLLVQ